MKKIISLVAVLCLIGILFCGCGKKSDKTSSDATNSQAMSTDSDTSPLNSNSSLTQGVEVVDTNDVDEDELPVNIDTGSTASSSSGKNNTSSSKPSVDSFSAVSGGSSSSNPSSSSSSSSSDAEVSNGSSSSSDNDENRDTMGNFSPWQ